MRETHVSVVGVAAEERTEYAINMNDRKLLSHEATMMNPHDTGDPPPHPSLPILVPPKILHTYYWLVTWTDRLLTFQLSQ